MKKKFATQQDSNHNNSFLYYNTFKKTHKNFVSSLSQEKEDLE